MHPDPGKPNPGRTPAAAYPAQHWRFAVCLCPPAASALYQLGSRVLGYDLRASRSCSLPDFLRPEWQAAVPLGFHLTLSEAYPLPEEALAPAERELRWLCACFSPETTLRLSRGRVEVWPAPSHGEDTQRLVLALNASPALHALHGLLAGRLSRYASAPPPELLPPPGAALPGYQRARLSVLKTPRGLDTWQPHFTLVPGYSGRDPEGLRTSLASRFGAHGEQTYSALTLATLRPGDSGWRVRADIPLGPAALEGLPQE